MRGEIEAISIDADAIEAGVNSDGSVATTEEHVVFNNGGALDPHADGAVSASAGRRGDIVSETEGVVGYGNELALVSGRRTKVQHADADDVEDQIVLKDGAVAGEFDAAGGAVSEGAVADRYLVGAEGCDGPIHAGIRAQALHRRIAIGVAPGRVEEETVEDKTGVVASAADQVCLARDFVSGVGSENGRSVPGRSLREVCAVAAKDRQPGAVDDPGRAIVATVVSACGYVDESVRLGHAKGEPGIVKRLIAGAISALPIDSYEPVVAR